MVRAAAAALGGFAILAVLLATGGGWSARAPRGTEEATPRPAPPDDALARLAAELRDPDPDRRVEAALALRALGEPAVPVFVALLRDGDPAGRLLAVRSLLRMGPLASAGVPALLEALADPALRRLAVDALVSINDRGAADALLALLGDPDPALVLAVLSALQGFKPDTPEAALALAALVVPDTEGAAPEAALRALQAMGPAALPALPTLLRAFEDPDLLSPAIHAVGAIGPAASAAIPALVRVVIEENLREEREAEEERARMFESGDVIYLSSGHGPHPDLEAGSALARIGEVAVPQLLALLAHESDGVRRNARWALLEVDDAAVPQLALAAGNADPRVRASAAEAMPRHAKNHPELLDAVVRLQGDADAEVREAATESLGAFGAAATPAVVAALDDPDFKVVSAALRAYARIAPRDPAVIPRLVKLLDHDASLVRWYAAEAIAALGEAAGPGIPALARCLGDECHLMRQEAREALTELGPVAIPALLAAVDHAPAAAQRGTLRLLAAKKELPDEGLAACRRLLVAADGGVRAQAAAVLAIHGARDEELLSHLAAGLAHDDWETRDAVNDGIAALGEAAAPLLPEVLRAVVREGERESQRAFLCDALAAAARTEPDALVRALGDASEDLPCVAAAALEEMGDPAVPSLARMLKSDSADLRLKAVEILGAVAKRSAAARAVLVDAAADPALRVAALSRLWNATNNAGLVVPALLKDVQAGTAASAKAANLLAAVGAKAAFAVKEIRAAHAAATDEEVRSALARAIEAIDAR